jgi:hypothetical protein
MDSARRGVSADRERVDPNDILRIGGVKEHFGRVSLAFRDLKKAVALDTDVFRGVRVER